jgi:tripartite-type tricarboxylate transporter receptor subunit TctC
MRDHRHAMGRASVSACAGLLAIGCMPVPSAAAQSAAEFYKNRPISVLIGGGVGGGYDLYVRTFLRYAGKHIPGNPTFIAKNVPAASGIVAANTLFSSAEKDGSVIGAFTNSAPMDPLFGNTAARYDPRKFNWLGSLGKLQNVCSIWHTSSIRSIAQAREREVIVAAAGPATNSAIMPRVLNALLGTRFKVITGYDAGLGVNMAVERGEAEGICGLSWPTIKASRPNWITDKLISVIVQIGFDKLADLPDVPSAQELVTDSEKRKVLELILLRQEPGRPLAAPPDVPADRLALLRAGFEQTMTDPDYLAEAAKSQMEIDPLSAAQIDALLATAYATPKSIVQQAAALIEPTGARR